MAMSEVIDAILKLVSFVQIRKLRMIANQKIKQLTIVVTLGVPMINRKINSAIKEVNNKNANTNLGREEIFLTMRVKFCMVLL